MTFQKETATDKRKWQKMFRYVAEREKATNELIAFVHLVDDLEKQSVISPETIRGAHGKKIYL